MRAPRQVFQMGGQDVTETVLEDGDVSVSLLSLGCITRDWRVPVGGARVPVVLGFADPQRYLDNPDYLGVIAGRVANRTGFGRFRLDGRAYALACNAPPHHLHGGPGGLSSRNWQAEADTARNAVRMTHVSADGDAGYPGTVRFQIDIRLSGHRLTYDMHAAPDRPTPINLAQHSYYNLMGGGAIWGQKLTLAAGSFTEADATLLPTGAIQPVAGTALDFTQPTTLDQDRHRAIDTNMIVDAAAPGPVATLSADNGLTLRMWTDQPGVQVYTSGGLNAAEGAHPGQRITPGAGLCLEPQHFPDSLNNPAFPSIIHTPDRPYRQRLKIEIAP